MVVCMLHAFIVMFSQACCTLQLNRLCRREWNLTCEVTAVKGLIPLTKRGKYFSVCIMPVKKSNQTNNVWKTCYICIDGQCLEWNVWSIIWVLKNRHKMEKKFQCAATLSCFLSIDGDGILPQCASSGTPPHSNHHQNNPKKHLTPNQVTVWKKSSLSRGCLKIGFKCLQKTHKYMKGQAI